MPSHHCCSQSMPLTLRVCMHALQVDYSRMETDLLARKEAQVRAATATLKPKETPVSGKGAEFHAALSRFTGVDETKLLAPAEVRSLTQGERVKRLASQLHALFNQYDNGESNMWTQHSTQYTAVQHFTAHTTTPPNTPLTLCAGAPLFVWPGHISADVFSEKLRAYGLDVSNPTHQHTPLWADSLLRAILNENLPAWLPLSGDTRSQPLVAPRRLDLLTTRPRPHRAKHGHQHGQQNCRQEQRENAAWWRLWDQLERSSWHQRLTRRQANCHSWRP